MQRSASKVIWYIQNSLSEGRETDEYGFYSFTRKELCDGAGISSSTFSNNLFDITYFFENEYYLPKWAKYDEYPVNMISDLKYEKGKLMFRRNPESCILELDRFWALHPLHNTFAYDCFDEKHRRRHNYPVERMYDSFPWNWSEEQIEASMKEKR